MSDVETAKKKLALVQEIYQLETKLLDFEIGSAYSIDPEKYRARIAERKRQLAELG